MSWEKDGFFWIKDGSFGDLLFNTCDRIIRVKDSSSWAYSSIIYCGDLIRAKKRWPDRMSDDTCVNAWFARIINRTINQIAGKYLLPYRYQHRMVRDIYIAYYTLALEFNYGFLIEATPPVWYVYTPSFWAWYNYVKTRDVKYLKRYRFWRRFTRKKTKPFKIRLDELRELAIRELQKQAT